MGIHPKAERGTESMKDPSDLRKTFQIDFREKKLLVWVDMGALTSDFLLEVLA